MAALSKRRSIINLIITNLKEIDGGVSPFSSSYTFSTNLFNNVFRGAENLENVNDFPVIYAFAGPEVYEYQTAGNTEGSLTVLLRCYLKNGDRTLLRAEEDNLVQDIDHVIYQMSTSSDNIQTIGVVMVDSSQGLLDEYAIVEIRISVKYELDLI
jgi:hypothetical protein